MELRKRKATTTTTTSSKTTRQKKKKNKESCVNPKIVKIEACKSWGVFKTRANKIERFLKEADHSIQIEINAEKVRGDFFLIVSYLI